MLKMTIQTTSSILAYISFRNYDLH